LLWGNSAASGGRSGVAIELRVACPRQREGVSCFAIVVEKPTIATRAISAHKWRGLFRGTALFAGRWRQPANIISGEAIHMKYEKPAVQRFGTVREITLGSGPNTPGDATNLYHRS
jgi:hypothetical protein